MGLSLDEVRATLGIPQHYLEAMEEGGSRLVADEFYLIPFLRKYADLLEIDPAVVVGRFLAEARRDSGRDRLQRPRGLPAAWVIGGSVAAATLILLAWLSLG